jgi:SAM-dependent methyltransferase
MAGFYDKYRVKEQSVSEIEERIGEYIQESEADAYHDVLQKDSRWLISLHLSELRAGILSWYDFSPNAEILEVDGNFGELTGILCERGKHVTVTEKSDFRAKTIAHRHRDRENLDVYSGDVLEMPFQKKFDYIVLIGTLEWQGQGKHTEEIFVQYLQRIKQFLKPGGKILIAVENRCGLKYFCGTIEPHTRRVFDGLNHYPQGTSGYSFTKQELVDILHLSQMKQFKFYYPLPDYLFPEVVFSENFLPQEGHYDRIPFYSRYRETLFLSERELYADIIKNHVFEFFANSFFVECSDNANSCKIDYAVITSDRGKKNSLCTNIYANGIVQKKAVFSRGNACIDQLHQNMMCLKQQGINVVPFAYENHVLEMPYIESPLLLGYLKSLKATDKESVFYIFDKLWEKILQSSKHVESDKNRFLNGICEDQAIDWGPILETAYLEMVPMNCFYKNHDFIFFDQEFVVENCPAKYPMFRTIRYSHEFIQDIISLEELKSRYYLKNAWNRIQMEEEKFLHQLRHGEIYNAFHRKMGLNQLRIERNAEIINLFKNS